MSGLKTTAYTPKAPVLLYKSNGEVRPFGYGALTDAARGTALVAAVAAAVSGDEIQVGPGTYTVAGNLAKNGVNWHFAAGATVTRSTGTGAIFDDSANGANGAVNCRISGAGAFLRNGTVGAANATIMLANSASDVTMHCHSIANNNGELGTTSDAAVYQVGGKLRIVCDRITSTTTNGIWWENGEMFITVDELDCQWICYVAVPQITTWSTGAAYVTAKKIRSDYLPILQAMENAEARSWIFATEIISHGVGNDGGMAIASEAAGKLYVVCEKVGTTNGGAGTNQPTVAVIAGELWLTAQKCSSSDYGAVICTGGTHVIDVAHFEDTLWGATTKKLIEVTGGTVDLRAGKIIGGSGASGVTVSGTGTLNLLSGKITTNAAKLDLTRSAGTLNVATGVAYDPAKTSGTITQLGPIYGVTPGATGLALLDDATAAAARTTLGILNPSTQILANQVFS